MRTFFKSSVLPCVAVAGSCPQVIPQLSAQYAESAARLEIVTSRSKATNPEFKFPPAPAP